MSNTGRELPAVKAAANCRTPKRLLRVAGNPRDTRIEYRSREKDLNDGEATERRLP